MAMDFGTYGLSEASEKGAKMPVTDPVSGKPFDGVFVNVVGSDSKTYRRAYTAMRRSIIGLDKSPDEDQVDSFEADAIAKCITGWDGIVWEGKPLPYTHENAVMLVKKHHWIIDQIELFIRNRENFFSQKLEG